MVPPHPSLDTFPVRAICHQDAGVGGAPAQFLPSLHTSDILVLQTLEVPQTIPGEEPWPVVFTGDATGHLCAWQPKLSSPPLQVQQQQGQVHSPVLVWDALRIEDHVNGHTRAIRCIETYMLEGNSFLFTAGDDGLVKIWGHDPPPHGEQYHGIQNIENDPRPTHTARFSVDGIVGLHVTELPSPLLAGETFDALLVAHASGFLQVYDLTSMKQAQTSPAVFPAVTEEAGKASEPVVPG
jgi:hypothetical protein